MAHHPALGTGERSLVELGAEGPLGDGVDIGADEYVPLAEVVYYKWSLEIARKITIYTHPHYLRLAMWPLEATGERLEHATLEMTKIYTRPAELALQIPLLATPWATARWGRRRYAPRWWTGSGRTRRST